MRYNLLASVFFSAILILAQAAHATQIDSIDFKKQDAETLVEISGDSLSGFSKEEKKSPPQLVLTFDNAEMAETAKKNFDASSLGGNILQISSYTIAGGKARVVVDFTSSPQYTIDESDKKITLHVLGKTDATVDTKTADTTTLETKVANKDAISTVMSSEQTHQFTGSPITLKLRDADVHEVLRLIGETSGFNIIIHPSVNGKLTLSLDQVPWDQALDVVLTTLKLGAERTGSVLRVMPRDMLTKEKQDEIDQKKLIAQATPRITRVFPISYSDMAQLATLLQSFANSQNNSPGASGVPTTILIDQNTQSLIVRDTAENVERIHKMIALLDVQTPQVLIEAKTVEASEDFSRTLGGNLGFVSHGYSLGFNQAPPSNALAGGAGSAATASGSSGGSSNTSQIVMGIAGSLGLNANLQYQESISKAKIISSPKTVVLSGKSSSINQVTAYSYTNTNAGSAGVAATSTTVSATANTKLDVTPRVTNDGSVFMKLNLTRDVLNLSNVNAPISEPRTLSTEVIVDSGNTLVIGGVLNLDENTNEQGIPFLRKLPIIGWLFGSDVYLREKSELMFFITPRILNQKKTALGNNYDDGPKT
jgi:type IV pilus assembly protein PilQ